VIRKLLKWFLYLCLLLLAGLITLVLCKDTLIRNLTERRITAQTGLYVRIDRLHVGFREPVISMQGCRLYNLPEFGGGLLLHLKDLHLEYDPEALQSGALHLHLVRLDLEELNIVRNAAGRTNLTDFIDRAGTEGRDALSRRLPAGDFGFTGIDTLDLSLGRIRFLDLRDARRNREAYFGVKHVEIKNIRSQDDLYGVAAIVLLRSGVVNLGAPPRQDGTRSVGILDLGMDWLKSALGLDFRLPTETKTNPPTAEGPSP
jgi:hypothetical protein